MRLKDRKDVYLSYCADFPCNLCGGEKIDNQCPLQAIHGGVLSTARGVLNAMGHVIEGKIPLSQELANYIYTDPLCGSCKVHCEGAIDMATYIRTLRADLVDAGFAPLPQHVPLLQGMKNYSNPWVIPKSRRGDWAKKLKVKDATKGKVDILYYVGCTAASDANLRHVPQSAANLLNAAGLNWGILGPYEECCGTIAYQLGDWNFFEMQGKKNIEALNKTGADVIVTACAGCFKILKNIYPKQGIGEVNARVMHLSEFLEELIGERKLKITRELPRKVTYHDPCHLGRESGEEGGRFAGVFEAPRNVVKSIPGLELVEMERNSSRAWCCGAGGGLKSGFMDHANKIGSLRVKEAEQTGAEILVSACPFCENHLTDSLKASNIKMEVKDIVEVMNEVL